MSGAISAVSDFVSDVGSAIFDSPIVDTVATVASVVPGPWQPIAAGYQVFNNLAEGDLAGAALSFTGTDFGGGDWGSLDWGEGAYNIGGVDPSAYGSWDVPGYGEGMFGGGSGGFLGEGVPSGIPQWDNAPTSQYDWNKMLNQYGPRLISGGLSAAGGMLQQQAARDAAATQAQAQIRAAQIAADAAKFRPVGVTTRFGASRFGYDPVTGNVTSAGYALSPEMKAQQDKLMGVSENMLSQYQGAQAATAPMGEAAQRMMTLGQGYLATSPQEQAAKYLAEQQALLATGRERELSSLENRLLQQGRLGMATGGTSTGMMAANPELEAWYNAKRQQDLALAAQATQGGMDYAKFGAGMVGGGGDMLKGMYGTQQAAYAPYQTALGGAGYIEGLGQQAMEQGINIGAKGTAATAQSGMLLGQGMQNAAATQYKADATSPWGALLSGAGSAMQPMQQQYAFNPYTGQPIKWGT